MEIPVAALPNVVDSDSGGALRAIAVPVVSAFTAFTLYTIGATWQYVGSALVNALTAVLFLGLVAVVLLAVRPDRHELMPWWGSTVVLIGVPVMTNLERLVAAQPNPTGDWSSEAGSALLFVVVATGPLWVAPAAALSWFIAQELALVELTQPGMFVIVVAALLGWQLRRGRARAQDIGEEVSEERLALAASQEQLAQTGSRYRDVDTSGLIVLLDELAAGRLDPADDAVRSTCQREERMIRTVLRLHPERVQVHRDLVALASAARDSDIDLSISLVEDIPATARLTTKEAARALIQHAQPGSQARASITRTDHGCVFRLVVHIESPGLVELPTASEVVDEAEGLVALEEPCGSPGSVPPALQPGSDAQRSTHV